MKLELDTIKSLKTRIEILDSIMEKYAKASFEIPVNTCVNDCINLINKKEKIVYILTKIDAQAKKLSDNDYAIFKFYYVENEHAATISQAMNISLRTVFRRLAEIKKAIESAF